MAMNNEKLFAKSADGLIHLVSAIHSEYTMCGDAFEGNPGEFDENDDPQSWVKCESQPITCPKCIIQILNCRGVKIKKSKASSFAWNETIQKLTASD